MWEQTKDKTLLCFARHILWMYAWCVLIGSERKKRKGKNKTCSRQVPWLWKIGLQPNFQKKGKIKRKRLTLYVAYVCFMFFFLFFVISLLRNFFLCWDRRSSDVPPTLLELYSSRAGSDSELYPDFDHLMLQSVMGYQL